MADHADFTGLEKHGAVLQLLANLEQRLGCGAFQVADHWESDLDAVGIADPRNRERLAYIAVYGPDDFYVELELPPPPDSEFPYSLAGEFRCTTFDEVAQIVAKHLALDPHRYPTGGLGKTES
jgi:hypothetical protein